MSDLNPTKLGEKHWHHAERTCPVCKENLNASIGANTTEAPATGALSICGYCASILVFDADLTLREPNAAEWREINDDPEIFRARQAVRHLIGHRLGDR